MRFRAIPVVLLLFVSAATGRLFAQQRDSIPGVTLGMVYESAYQPALGIQPFTGRFGGGGVASQVEAIIGRDLRNSDRFSVLDSLPAGLMSEGVDYKLWDRLGAVWLVTGQVEGAGDGYVLVLELHDVVYAKVKETGRFRLPDPASEAFRMAVHRISDQIVTWATGDPGMAASRIAFSMPTSDSTKELYVIDSDGENLRRVTSLGSIAMSPAWSWDGKELAFTTVKPGDRRLYELDLATDRMRTFDPLPSGQYLTPAFSPDGKTLAFASLGGSSHGIFTYDVADNCCLKHLSGGASWKDLSPTYSPDGRRIAFNTDRFGTVAPQIMIMSSGGGDPETLSPLSYGNGGYYTSPDWSPAGDLVAFHGRIQSGSYEILVADLKDGGRRLRQLTWEGNNEDPTWAPDGRHLAFVGVRDWGTGLMVVDVATGRIRLVLSGRRVGVPDWSPALGPGSPPATGGGS